MKSSVFNLVLTVFLFWLTIQLNTSLEEYLAYALIITIGILHGSNDLALISVLKGEKKLSRKYLIYYTVLILLNIVAFLFSSSLALFFFVIISCYHFGEQHFHNQIKQLNTSSRLLFVSYGALIFGMLFYFNAEQTSIIIKELIDVSFSRSHFFWFLITGLVATLCFYVVNFKNFTKNTNHFQEAFLIVLFIVLFDKAALLWAFSIYFIVWHSIPSLQDQIKVLYGDESKVSFMQYVKSSFVYWLISVAGLVILYYTTSYFNVDFITVFFAFLAAITVPHVVVMYLMNKEV
ncbi:MAG: beta-carotene 15,15'-dioxygenase, Brp/Blh family [Winogradskyella sp.]|uniref:Brp/Blh family beta-carotene 15,15'-dioxygenase n=1 Tax=Winogradskyella sp. TaxID=1883156 RepID=UPI0025E66D0A|nr:Brp/Blh family beta-carotene 15,15'-dioxygenase [Winogradskyella sp.]NRB61165.1 beta-carotene 15,15'-dioxygenase, Brp/Blh family [Winogradskyella sp.]